MNEEIAEVRRADGAGMVDDSGSPVWLAFCILTATVAALLGFGAARAEGVELSRAMGHAFGALIWPGVVVLLFRLGKRYRKRRTQQKIYFATALFFLVGSCARLAQISTQKTGDLQAFSVAAGGELEPSAEGTAWQHRGLGFALTTPSLKLDSERSQPTPGYFVWSLKQPEEGVSIVTSATRLSDSSATAVESFSQGIVQGMRDAAVSSEHSFQIDREVAPSGHDPLSFSFQGQQSILFFSGRVLRLPSQVIVATVAYSPTAEQARSIAESLRVAPSPREGRPSSGGRGR